MPFLRVIRDKRGYETTYLMHLYREGHRQRVSHPVCLPIPWRRARRARSAGPDVLREVERSIPILRSIGRMFASISSTSRYRQNRDAGSRQSEKRLVAALAPDVRRRRPHPHLHRLRHLRLPLARYRQRLKVRLPTIRSHSSGDGMRSFVNASHDEHPIRSVRKR